MIIHSIGHDIVENQRIKALFEKYTNRFINKVLSESEKRILETKTDKVRFLAKRFAAKEAFAKACGIGLREPILMPKISVGNDKFGKPYFILDNTIKEYLDKHSIVQCHLSLSDEINLSSAFVVLEKKA